MNSSSSRSHRPRPSTKTVEAEDGEIEDEPSRIHYDTNCNDWRILEDLSDGESVISDSNSVILLPFSRPTPEVITLSDDEAEVRPARARVPEGNEDLELLQLRRTVLEGMLTKENATQEAVPVDNHEVTLMELSPLDGQSQGQDVMEVMHDVRSMIDHSSYNQSEGRGVAMNPIRNGPLISAGSSNPACHGVSTNESPTVSFVDLCSSMQSQLRRPVVNTPIETHVPFGSKSDWIPVQSQPVSSETEIALDLSRFCSNSLLNSFRQDAYAIRTSTPVNTVLDESIGHSSFPPARSQNQFSLLRDPYQLQLPFSPIAGDQDYRQTPLPNYSASMHDTDMRSYTEFPPLTLSPLMTFRVQNDSHNRETSATFQPTGIEQYDLANVPTMVQPPAVLPNGWISTQTPLLTSLLPEIRTESTTINEKKKECYLEEKGAKKCPPPPVIRWQNSPPSITLNSDSDDQVEVEIACKQRPFDEIGKDGNLLGEKVDEVNAFFARNSVYDKNGRDNDATMEVRCDSPSRKRGRSPVRIDSNESRRKEMRRQSLVPTRRNRCPVQQKRNRSPTPSLRNRIPSPLRHKRTRNPSSPRPNRSPSPLRRNRSPASQRQKRTSTPPTQNRSSTPSRRKRTPALPKRRRTPTPTRQTRSPVQLLKKIIPSPPPPQDRNPSQSRVRRVSSPSPHRHNHDNAHSGNQSALSKNLIHILPSPPIGERNSLPPPETSSKTIIPTLKRKGIRSQVRSTSSSQHTVLRLVKLSSSDLLKSQKPVSFPKNLEHTKNISKSGHRDVANLQIEKTSVPANTEDEEEMRAKLLIEVSKARLQNQPQTIVPVVKFLDASTRSPSATATMPRPTVTITTHPTLGFVRRISNNKYQTPPSTSVPVAPPKSTFPLIQRTIINQGVVTNKRNVKRVPDNPYVYRRDTTTKPIKPIIINVQNDSSSEEDIPARSISPRNYRPQKPKSSSPRVKMIPNSPLKPLLPSSPGDTNGTVSGIPGSLSASINNLMENAREAVMKRLKGTITVNGKQPLNAENKATNESVQPVQAISAQKSNNEMIKVDVVPENSNSTQGQGCSMNDHQELIDSQNKGGVPVNIPEPQKSSSITPVVSEAPLSQSTSITTTLVPTCAEPRTENTERDLTGLKGLFPRKETNLRENKRRELLLRERLLKATLIRKMAKTQMQNDLKSAESQLVEKRTLSVPKLEGLHKLLRGLSDLKKDQFRLDGRIKMLRDQIQKLEKHKALLEPQRKLLVDEIGEGTAIAVQIQTEHLKLREKCIEYGGKLNGISYLLPQAGLQEYEKLLSNIRRFMETLKINTIPEILTVTEAELPKHQEPQVRVLKPTKGITNAFNDCSESDRESEVDDAKVVVHRHGFMDCLRGISGNFRKSYKPYLTPLMAPGVKNGEGCETTGMRLNPNLNLCTKELHGSCDDPDCKFQHLVKLLSTSATETACDFENSNVGITPW